MPIHDWTRVSAGTFHDFHVAWIAELRRALNGGLLPPGFYAQAEQVANEVIPDVLALEEAVRDQGEGHRAGGNGKAGGGVGLDLAITLPRVTVRESAGEAMLLAAKRRRLVIRHATGDRIVALIEIVSPGNKDSRRALDQFIGKAVAALDTGYHLLVMDLFPPGPFDPTGIHGAIWQQFGGKYNPPAGKPLTLAAYAAAGIVNCFVEPTGVGTELIPMPLFLDPGHYINVPLEQTYLGAYEGVPGRWKRVIEGGA